jgi:MarR family transcriptional regulator, organic hydroperoxide resistance regulator
MESRFDTLIGYLHEIAWQFGPRGINGECCGDLSMPEFRALKKASATENCSVRQIASALDFSKSGATRIVGRLEKKGYIRRRRSVEDRRVCCVSITPTGRTVLVRVIDEYRSKLGELMAEMDPVAAVALPRVLSLLLRAVADKAGDTVDDINR